jgi:GH24 family phage-related lysozyme (muramidase)
MSHGYNLLSVTVLALSFFVIGCEQQKPRSFPTLDKRAPGSLTEPVDRSVDIRQAVREISPAGLQLTKDSEGFVSELYNDAANYCTIAYGHLIKLAPCDGSEPGEFLQGITEEQGTRLLQTDMRRSQLSVMRYVEVELTDGQYAALCDFVFNVGSGNFRNSTLLKVLNANDYAGVPFQLRRWVKAGGRELEGLKRRREKEIALFSEGLAIPRDFPRGEETIDLEQGEQL